MGDHLRTLRNRLRERSQKRRELLAKQLGIDSVDKLSSVLGNRVDPVITPPPAKILKPIEKDSNSDAEDDFDYCATLEEIKTPENKKEGQSVPEDDDEYYDEEYYHYVQPEEEIYKDSKTFLKGTQSANPHNDYCQHFVDTGQRPQNFIRDVGLADRFEEYPKLRELIRLKDGLIAKTASPPMFLACDLDTFEMRDLDSKFDVILVEPPLEEYQRTAGVTNMKLWSWEEIMKLEIEEVAAARSFIFLWCGSSDGLDLGRKCFRKWGFRRCEDICWIKTNINNPGRTKNLESKAVFQRTKEHCLMGIKGTVRRSTDGDFIHANVDIDLIISEEPEYGSLEKPVEIFHIIEHFCLGRRRLHVFGQDCTIRPGWLTIGPGLTNSNFNSETYNSYFNKTPNGHLTGCTERIEALRPKSPPPKVKGGAAQGPGARGGMNRGNSQQRGNANNRGGITQRGGNAQRGVNQGWGGRGNLLRGSRSRGSHRGR